MSLSARSWSRETRSGTSQHACSGTWASWRWFLALEGNWHRRLWHVSTRTAKLGWQKAGPFLTSPDRPPHASLAQAGR
jgi:hypothetical protein